MDVKELKSIVKQTILERFAWLSPSQVTDEAIFQFDLGFDSLDMAELMMALEEKFDCVIPDDRGSEVKTVNEAVLCVEECVKKGRRWSNQMGVSV